MTTLRRLGYRLRTVPRDPIPSRLERAGLRLTPLNRLHPGTGHAYAPCPACGNWSGLWVDPDGTWTTTCGCSGGGDAIDLDAFLRSAA